MNVLIFVVVGVLIFAAASRPIVARLLGRLARAIVRHAPWGHTR